jgi:hypothetical protein
VRLRLGSSPQERGGAVPIVGQENKKAATEGAPRRGIARVATVLCQAAFIHHHSGVTGGEVGGSLPIQP